MHAICGPTLRNLEDVAHAIFVVWSLRARGLNSDGTLVGWLHGVAMGIAHFPFSCFCFPFLGYIIERGELGCDFRLARLFSERLFMAGRKRDVIELA